MEYGREIRSLFTASGEGGRVERAKSVVHIFHASRSRRLVVGNDASICELYVAPFPLIPVFKDRHQTGLLTSQEGLLHCPVIARQIGVSIQGQEPIA